VSRESASVAVPGKTSFPIALLDAVLLLALCTLASLVIGGPSP
jgi:hypothetical protein